MKELIDSGAGSYMFEIHFILYTRDRETIIVQIIYFKLSIT